MAAKCRYGSQARVWQLRWVRQPRVHRDQDVHTRGMVPSKLEGAATLAQQEGAATLAQHEGAATLAQQEGAATLAQLGGT